MAQPQELETIHISRGDFLYKLGNDTEWTRLLSPLNDPKHNCYGIRFDNYVTLTQKHYTHGSKCRVKLILMPPIVKTEDDQLTVEAVCVEVLNPSFYSNHAYKDEAKAIEHAKTLPLATLPQPITAVKLRNLSEQGRRGAIDCDNSELGQRIWALIEHGYRARRFPAPKKFWAVPPRQTNSSADTFVEMAPTPQVGLPQQHVAAEDGKSSWRQDTEAVQPQQSNGSADTSVERKSPPQVGSPQHHVAAEEELRQAAEAVKPQQSNGSVETFAENKPKPLVRLPPVESRHLNASADTFVARTPTLEERLQQLRVEEAEAQARLQYQLEDDRQAMLWAVSKAINTECNRRLADALQGLSAETLAKMQQVVAEYRF